MISFGPVPSRRLGRSLGINNIPLRKICSFSCVYCQVGITKDFRIACCPFYTPDEIFNEVQKHLKRLTEQDKPDYLTFVANGEPTLDIHLGKSIEKLKSLNIPVAVITNASLLNVQQVRDNLKPADWVSIKIDANDELIWKKINRPGNGLDFRKHIEGLFQFSSEFKGKLVTETMLIEGMNDSTKVLDKTSDIIKQINPSIAYISIPTRPPAVSEVKAPDEHVINEAFQIFSNKGLHTELLIGFEGTEVGTTGNAVEDITNMCAVHPIREDTMMKLLSKDKAGGDILESLLRKKIIKKVSYHSAYYYIRQLHG